MTDDQTRLFHAGLACFHGNECFRLTVSRLKLRVMPCLHENGLPMKGTLAGQIVNGFQKPRERLSGIADGHENQRSRPPLTAFGKYFSSGFH